MARNKKEEIQLNQPVASQVTDFKSLEDSGDFLSSNVDQKKVNELEDKILNKKKEISNKVYAVSLDSETFEAYSYFMKNQAEWSGMESLGIKEVNKAISNILKDGGVKNSVIYLNSLVLEASHYFISKSRGKGLKEAEDFLRIYKPLDQALSDSKDDVMEIKNLEKELAAAMQGIELS